MSPYSQGDRFLFLCTRKRETRRKGTWLFYKRVKKGNEKIRYICDTFCAFISDWLFAHRFRFKCGDIKNIQRKPWSCRGIWFTLTGFLGFLVFSVQSVQSVRVWVFECLVFDIRCSMLDVQCSMFDVQCSMFGVRCSMDVCCHVLNWNFSSYFVMLIILILVQIPAGCIIMSIICFLRMYTFREI